MSNQFAKAGSRRLDGWIAMLWNAMAKTGHGYKRPSLKHTGIDDDRRNDKMRETTGEFEKDDGSLGIRPVFVPFIWGESKIERAARQHRIGVRHG